MITHSITVPPRRRIRDLKFAFSSILARLTVVLLEWIIAADLSKSKPQASRYTRWPQPTASIISAFADKAPPWSRIGLPSLMAIFLSTRIETKGKIACTEWVYIELIEFHELRLLKLNINVDVLLLIFGNVVQANKRGGVEEQQT